MNNNTVCLCGSTRFLKDFDEANRELTSRGLTVLTISMCLPKNEQGNEDDAALKELLDLVHLNKILRSDAVLIVGDGYIGKSTAREILWAHMQGKSIVAQSDCCRSWDNVAGAVRAGNWVTHIVPKAKEILGLRY